MLLQKAGQGEAAMALLAKYEAFFKTVKNTTAEGRESLGSIVTIGTGWRAEICCATRANSTRRWAPTTRPSKPRAPTSHARTWPRAPSRCWPRRSSTRLASCLQDITPQDGAGGLAGSAYLAMGDVLFAKKEWGPGCQNFACALAQLKATQVPRLRLNDVLTDVERRS